MKREEYDSKVRALLQETTYRVLRTDPTAKTIREAKEIIKKSSIPHEEQRTLLATAPKPPRFYGLPKVHKEGIPLRPIVSQIDAPTYHLARYLARHLQPHMGKTSSHVKNSADFVEILQGVTMEDKDIMVSFDVESLFTNVPIDDSLEIIRGLQTKGFPEDYANLVEFCLRKTYFTWNGQIYEQAEGASMGSPLTPVVANLFMEKFEAEAMDSYSKKPKLWLRYVDDTFVIWPHGEKCLQDYLRHLNAQHPAIKFTMEVEDNNQLPFLDVLVKKKKNGKLGHAR
ncbi:uncharacterized protein LOC124156652 [Ischnura elegans]|uniref:uncharacterized protein LOC124156652 n=1 Tax=Ischnura elegans TaxID=197161 RepID=UPI001ED87938|nr:uncharacterized protein LOC124156652 [Ischnura elegans]